MKFLPRRTIRLAIPCLALLAAAAFASRANAGEYTKTYPIQGRADVHVNADDGSVRVTTSDTAQVDFRVEYTGYTLGKNLHIDSREEGNRVDLTAHTPQMGIALGVSNKRLSIEVRMPKDADLQIQTGDGPVDISSINGNVTVRSGDGRLRVTKLTGTIDLHTGDGGINADSLKGDLRLHTGDGSIQATDLDGKCDATTGDGHVGLAGRFDSLSIKSGDGPIDARVVSGSKMANTWNIRSGDGSVELLLPPDFQASLDASTGDGRISLGLPVTVEGRFSNSQVRGKMNGGGPALIIHTGDGAIRLNKG